MKTKRPPFVGSLLVLWGVKEKDMIKTQIAFSENLSGAPLRLRDVDRNNIAVIIFGSVHVCVYACALHGFNSVINGVDKDFHILEEYLFRSFRLIRLTEHSFDQLLGLADIQLFVTDNMRRRRLPLGIEPQKCSGVPLRHSVLGKKPQCLGIKP